MGEKILLVDDQRMVLDHLAAILTRRGYEVTLASTGNRALGEFETLADELSLVVLDLDLGGPPNGLDVLQRMKAAQPDVPVIMLSGKGTIEAAVEAIKLGAADFLEKDLSLEEHLDASVEKVKQLLAAIEENKRLRAENEELQRRAYLLDSLLRRKYEIVGQSSALQEVLGVVEKIASLPRPVLVVGERGVGKELVAAAIHYRGARAEGPFVTVNCAAFHGQLLESEMFGHEKGAFTGADKQKLGRFEMAHQGTLFLDEIGNMSMDFQEKILRVIEYQEFERVQGTETIRVDVRVIAATNADLQKQIEAGSFRADLYDRLAFQVITVPPLRERTDDIPLLVDHFVARMVEEAPSVKRRAFSGEATAVLQKYAWPGNLRQLKNVVERVTCQTEADPVEPVHLPSEVFGEASAGTSFADLVSDLERRLLADALRKTGGSQKQAAETLGMSYDQFRHYYKKHQFGKQEE